MLASFTIHWGSFFLCLGLLCLAGMVFAFCQAAKMNETDRTNGSDGTYAPEDEE